MIDLGNYNGEAPTCCGHSMMMTGHQFMVLESESYDYQCRYCQRMIRIVSVLRGPSLGIPGVYWSRGVLTAPDPVIFGRATLP